MDREAAVTLGAGMFGVALPLVLAAALLFGWLG